MPTKHQPLELSPLKTGLSPSLPVPLFTAPLVVWNGNFWFPSTEVKYPDLKLELPNMKLALKNLPESFNFEFMEVEQRSANGDYTFQRGVKFSW